MRLVIRIQALMLLRSWRHQSGVRVTPCKQDNVLYPFPRTYCTKHVATRTQDTAAFYRREKSNVFGVLEAESWNRFRTLSLFLLRSVRFYRCNIAGWTFGVSAISGSILFVFKIRREFLLQWSVRHIESERVHSTRRFLFEKKKKPRGISWY
jgi:hypothetical protein